MAWDATARITIIDNVLLIYGWSEDEFAMEECQNSPPKVRIPDLMLNPWLNNSSIIWSQDQLENRRLVAPFMLYIPQD